MHYQFWRYNFQTHLRNLYQEYFLEFCSHLNDAEPTDDKYKLSQNLRVMDDAVRQKAISWTNADPDLWNQKATMSQLF